MGNSGTPVGSTLVTVQLVFGAILVRFIRRMLIGPSIADNVSESSVAAQATATGWIGALTGPVTNLCGLFAKPEKLPNSSIPLSLIT
jgi:hypothetical protein